MGQYYKVVNTSKNEVPESERYLLKLTEHTYLGNKYMDKLLFLLNDEWKGDKVIHVGDYADRDDGTTTSEIISEIEEKNQIENVYDWACSFKGVKPKNNNLNIRYAYNLDKKEYIDLYNQPIQWFYLDKNNVECAKFNSLGFLIACGNGLGGGDYRTVNSDYVGYWANDRIETSDKLLEKYNDYNELDVMFDERYKFDEFTKYDDYENDLIKQEQKLLKEDLNYYIKYNKISDIQKFKICNDYLTDKEIEKMNITLKEMKKDFKKSIENER